MSGFVFVLGQENQKPKEDALTSVRIYQIN